MKNGILNFYRALSLAVWINVISKVCYEETQENGNKHLLFVPGSSCLKIWGNLQWKHLRGSTFSNKVTDYLTLTGNVFLENVFKTAFIKTPAISASAITCY